MVVLTPDAFYYLLREGKRSTPVVPPTLTFFHDTQAYLSVVLLLGFCRCLFSSIVRGRELVMGYPPAHFSGLTTALSQRVQQASNSLA